MLFDLERLRLGIEPLLNFSYQEYNTRPAYSITDTSERQLHLQVQDVALAELDAALDGVSDVIKQLTLVHTAVKLRSDAIRNSQAPASALPTEILHDIVRIAVHDARFPRSGGAIIKSPEQKGSSGVVSTLSRVCKRWREATLDLPELWTAVCMPWSNAVRAREMLVEYARRARDLPLDLSMWSPSQPVTELPLNDSLAPRVTSSAILLSPKASEPRRRTAHPTWKDGLSGLEHLTLNGYMQYPDASSAVESWMEGCRSMCLINVTSRLRLSGGFRNLETLTISKTDQFTLIDLCRTTRWPQIRHLTLIDVTVREGTRLEREPVYTFYSDSDTDPGDDAAKITSGGSLNKNLVSLRIIGCSDEIWLLICDNWKLGNLISFELRAQNRFTSSDAMNCIRAFVTYRKSLQYIHIILPMFSEGWLCFLPDRFYGGEKKNPIPPNARYMHVGLTQYDRDPQCLSHSAPQWIGSRDSATHKPWDAACSDVRKWIDERFLRLRGVKLYRVAIPKSLILIDDMQWYHDRVEVVDIIPTLETISTEPHPIFSPDCPSDLNYGITMEVYREE